MVRLVVGKQKKMGPFGPNTINVKKILLNTNVYKYVIIYVNKNNNYRIICYCNGNQNC